jgi:hypothetical protein
VVGFNVQDVRRPRIDVRGVSVWDDLVERATERELLAGLDPMAVTEAGGPDLVVRTLDLTRGYLSYHVARRVRVRVFWN